MKIMKTLIFLSALFLSLVGHANTAFEIEGPIQIQNGQTYLIDGHERIAINTKSKCQYARLLVTQSMFSENQLEVVQEIDCNKEVLCPKIFEPVCGEFEGKQIVFGNSCELYQSNADFIDYGTCSKL